jgi:hypothetical protein
MYARLAAQLITAWCRATAPNTDKMPDRWGSLRIDDIFSDVFDRMYRGTRKGIPAEKIDADLGEPVGEGVFGFWRMGDGSYLLLTCKGPLAFWSGKPEDKAEWHGLK